MSEVSLLQFDIHYLPYQAVDAVVAEFAQGMGIRDPNGKYYQLTTRWQPLSAGSAVHYITGSDGREIFRFHVRQLPEPNPTTSVGIEAILPEYAPQLRQLLNTLRVSIHQHQENLKGLAPAGVYAPPPQRKTNIQQPHDATREKLERLRALREQNIKRGRVAIQRQVAYDQIPISVNSVKQHARELHDRWDDASYRPSSISSISSN